MKGLSMRECLYGGASVVICVCLTLLLYDKAGLPMTAAVYLSLPAAVPIALTGFIKINGMTFPCFLKQMVRKKRHPLYLYQAEEVYLCEKEEKERQEAKAGKIRKAEQADKRNAKAARRKRSIRKVRLLVRKRLGGTRRREVTQGWHLVIKNLRNAKK